MQLIAGATDDPMKESKYFVIEGIVKQLEISKANVHFLANAENTQRTAGIAATIQAAAGEPGAVHIAQAASDSGDSVERFKMMLGTRAVSGNFWEITFQDGDHVRAVGGMQGKVFHAIAIVKSNGIIWMQPHCERGTSTKKMQLIKNSLAFTAGVFVVEGILLRNSQYPLWVLLAMPAAAVAVVLAVTVGMSWNDFMSLAKEMDHVGSALGVPEPTKIDLVKSTKKSRRQGKPELPMGVFYL